MDLEKLSLDELRKLESDVKKAITGYEARKRREALQAAEEAVRQHGLTLKDVFGGAPAGKRTASAPKYAHPENPSITWSGRGRQPGWIKDALAKGKKLDNFLIGR